MSSLLRSIIEKIDTIITNQEKTKDSKKPANEKKGEIPPQRTSYVLTIIVILVMIGQGYVNYLMWKQMKEQTGNNEKSIRLTDSSLTLTRDNAIIENRAWIGLERQPYGGGLCEGCDLKIPIKNFGKTPAESVSIGYKCFISKTFKLNRANLFWENTRMMSPNEPHEITISPHATDSERVRVNRGATNAYFYGIITYKDIYDRIDTTEFIYIDSIGNIAPAGINRIK